MANSVLVFGASGQVGSALMNALWNRVDVDVIGTCNSHIVPGYEVVDIRIRQDVFDVVRRVMPNTIYVAAYASNADDCESLSYTRQTNITGIFNVVDAAVVVKAKIVFYSSSYVFDGQQLEPYTVYDGVSPLQQYGVHKIIGESKVLSNPTGNLVIRTVGVFGQEVAGKNFAYQVLNACSRKEEMRVPDNQIMNPINNVHLATASIALVDSGFSGLAHIAGNLPVTKHQFALDIANEFGYRGDNIFVDNSEKGKAHRPHNGCLKSNIECDYFDGIRMFHDKQKQG